MKNKQKATGAAAVAAGRDGAADFAPSPEGSGEPGGTGMRAGGAGGSRAGSPWRRGERAGRFPGLQRRLRPRPEEPRSILNRSSLVSEHPAAGSCCSG